MYNIFFPKVSHLLCLVKKILMPNFIFFEGNQSMDADPPVIARQREDQFILVNAILQAPNSDQTVHRVDITFNMYILQYIGNIIFEYFR